ncbi:MAG: DUF4010 domain-containing protein [Bacteroidetes bacterium]|nr:MAG: DUF4010 domain-containing protein [Bacteroidota bacterium]
MEGFSVEQILHYLPKDLVYFLLVAVFSMLIGLEQRRHHDTDQDKNLLGTDRTFTFIGIWGFLLYLTDPGGWLFLAGMVILAGFLAMFYVAKIWKDNQYGLTSIMVALITYCLAPLIYTQSPVLVMLVLVLVLVLVETKDILKNFTRKFDKNEFITLATFLTIAGVVLPLMPDGAVLPGFDLTPKKFWLAVVAVSGISYVSYLLKKFAFPKSGLFLTGILGGIYSSTATTFTLAQKTNQPPLLVSASILAATAMMYPRIWLLAFLFNPETAGRLIVPLLILTGISGGVAFWFFRQSQKHPRPEAPASPTTQRNPLEFRAALLFAVLFVFFGLLTQWVLKNHGGQGVQWLSFIVGFTDIDPFLLNLFQSENQYLAEVVAAATIQATISNNILKAIYGISLGGQKLRRPLLTGFGVIIAAGFVVLWLLV